MVTMGSELSSQSATDGCKDICVELRCGQPAALESWEIVGLILRMWTAVNEGVHVTCI